MRVLWNNHRDWTNPRAGGAERTILEVGKRLISKGNEVTLLTSSWPSATREEVLNGIRVVRVPGNLSPHLRTPALSRQLKIDIVVDDLAHVVPWCSPWLTDAPTIAFFRHLHRRTLRGQTSPLGARALELVERLYPWIYRDCGFVVESSQSQSDLASLGIPQSRVEVIAPGVDLGVFRPGRVSDKPSLIFFSGLRKYKRPDHAIHAFKALTDLNDSCTLTIVGDLSEHGDLRELARRLGVENRVVFPGRVSEETLAGLVQSAWVNVNCSVAEGWGYSILEAAACGVPTAAYDVPGLREATGPAQAGVLAPDGDIRRLAAVVDSLISDRDRWAISARKFSEHFTWDRCASQWAELLQLACARGGASQWAAR